MAYFVSPNIRTDHHFPTAKVEGRYVHGTRYLVDIVTFDQDHWTKYGHVPFKTRREAEAYHRQQTVRPVIQQVMADRNLNYYEACRHLRTLDRAA